MHRDSSSSSGTLPSLDYLQPSPVRGRLEPHDELTSTSGCRFLQCTDTPNELKVLLPPRTAQIYALLLKAELVELEKHRDASWERILDIRRLKDRMIRKCQRLARAYSVSNPGTHIPFLTLHAPPDFRVKEIEKWIRFQEGSDVLKRLVSPDTLRQRGSFCCDRCANLVPHHHTISGRRPSVQTAHFRRSSVSEKLPLKGSTLSRRPTLSSTGDIKGTHLRPPSPNMSSSVINENAIQHIRGREFRSEDRTSLRASNQFQENVTSHVTSIVEERAQVRASKDRQSTLVDTSKFVEDKHQEASRSIHTIVEDPHELSMGHSDHSCVQSHCEVESLGRLSIASPDPLPVPYHGSTSAAFMEICDSPDETRPAANKLRKRDSFSENSSPSPPSEDEPTTDGMPQFDLPRRRSSLKRSNSELRMSMAYSTKTVSWAMDRDWAHQITKYHAAATQVEHADKEWGVICQKYQEELAGLKVLRRNVTQTLSKLRMETEKLQREDEVIRDQEEKIRQGYEQLEQKHGHYRAKVQAVLQETEQVLTLCGTKRDGELQN